MQPTQQITRFNFANSKPVIPPSNEYEAALERLNYIEKVKVAFAEAIKQSAALSPYTIKPSIIEEQQGMIRDLVDNLFFAASDSDRDTIHDYEEQEAREQREHEEIERALVRRL